MLELPIKEVLVVQVWIGGQPYCRVPDDVRAACEYKLRSLRTEHPGPIAFPAPVSLNDPLTTFVRMSAGRPPPKDLEEGVIDVLECFACHDAPMVIRPAADFRVELVDQNVLIPRLSARKYGIGECCYKGVG